MENLLMATLVLYTISTLAACIRHKLISVSLWGMRMERQCVRKWTFNDFDIFILCMVSAAVMLSNHVYVVAVYVFVYAEGNHVMFTVRRNGTLYFLALGVLCTCIIVYYTLQIYAINSYSLGYWIYWMIVGAVVSELLLTVKLSHRQRPTSAVVKLR